jgi:glycosyltransferase involved in cell wall biosynthesis
VQIVPKPWASAGGWFRLIKAIRRFRPDVINFHFCGVNHLPVFVFCRLTGQKVVFHYHGEIQPIETMGWRKRHFSGVRICSWFSNLIITVSEANKRYLRAAHVTRPIDMIYNGVDISKFSDRIDEAWPAETRDSDHFRICYMGSLIPRKRVDDLLRAFALVHAERPDARLTIIGCGYLDSQLKRLCTQLNLDFAVDFKGKILAFPVELLRNSDLFVSASEAESFGLIFGEAMCLGVPVVACRVGGIPEVVAEGETGILVPPRNPQALARALLELMANDDMRTRMAAAGKARVRSRFDLPDKVEAILEVLEDVAGTNGATHVSSVPAQPRS